MSFGSQIWSIITRISTRYLVAASLATVLLVAASCSSPTEECDACRTAAVVRGTVANQDGEPVDGVALMVNVYAGDCEVGVFRGGERAPVSASGGKFSTIVSTLYEPFTAGCIRVFPDPEHLSGLRSDTLAFSVNLQMREFKAGAVLDTAVVQYILAE
jgi:hypothetical protein